MDFAAVVRARIVDDEQGIGSAYTAFFAFTSESRPTTSAPATPVQAAITVSSVAAQTAAAPSATAATRSSARIRQRAASPAQAQLDAVTTTPPPPRRQRQHQRQRGGATTSTTPHRQRSTATATTTASAPRRERPSVIARKLNTLKKGRTTKSEAMRWKDPAVQKRLRELKQLWRDGVFTQPVSLTAVCTSLGLGSALKGAVHCLAWRVPSRTMSLRLPPTAAGGGRHPAPRVQQERHQPQHRVPPLQAVGTAGVVPPLPVAQTRVLNALL